MTITTGPQIGVSDVNQEVYGTPTHSSDLQFLNNLITPGQSAGSGTGGTGVAVANQRPSTVQLTNFYGLQYFQASIYGNCNNGNCSGYGNCGNINCRNCYASECINCSNCDSQAWLQSGTNCACTYNCNNNQVSYACNCTCACSKIICTKLFQIGMMPYNIFAADQQYGEWLKKNDRVVYRGYIKWAKIVTSWIDGGGPDFMVWIKNKEKRIEAQKKAATEWAYKIATPWSEHMAYLMGAVKNDNVMGRIIMNIGRPICKIVYFMPKKRVLPDVVSTWTMWALFFFSYYTSSTYVKLTKKMTSLKTLLLNKLIIQD